MAPARRPEIRDYGDRALIIECSGSQEVLALAEVLRDAGLAGVTDIVPAARTVLVCLDDPALQAASRSRLSVIDISAPVPAPGHQDADVTIDVIYDGEDLDAVAAHLGMPASAVIAAHTGTPWRVGFCGFAPGFAYLIEGDPRLDVVRRDEPRRRVPAGAVGLAGRFSGIYPRESPGGWQLIGRTDAVLWDVDREQPALLTPGMWVRFRAAAAQ